MVRCRCATHGPGAANRGGNRRRSRRGGRPRRGGRERMEIAFLTLFLGLASVTVPLELSAGPEITAIELQLDGKPVSHLTEPPWSTQLDLGADLLPHHLVARALNDGATGVARAEQGITLPRPPAEVQILLEPPRPGTRPTVRLTWRSLTNEAPAEVTLLLDGRGLPVDGGEAGPPAPTLRRRGGGRGGSRQVRLGQAVDQPLPSRQGKPRPPARDAGASIRGTRRALPALRGITGVRAVGG